MKWFRFYHDALDDPKVQRLPGDTFKFWVNLLCLASRSEERGLIVKSIEDIAFDLRVRDDEAAAMLADLIARGLIDEHVEGLEPHNWGKRQFKSDNVAERVTKHRARKKDADVTLRETLQVTPDETLKPSVNSDSQINRDTEGANAPSGADAPKPKPATKRKKREPSGPAQTFVHVLYEDVLGIGEPTNYGTAVGQAQRLVDAGCTVDELRDIAAWLQADPFWSQKGINMGTVLSQRDKWRAAKNAPPNTLTVHRGGMDDPDAPIVPGPRGYTQDQLRRLAEQERRRATS